MAAMRTAAPPKLPEFGKTLWTETIHDGISNFATELKGAFHDAPVAKFNLQLDLVGPISVLTEISGNGG